MPLQNRVTPAGTIESVVARGTFMGNRGVLHNAEKEVQRLFKIKPWITCLLEFKGRQRELMSPGAYTELFFLDEVTAFAAGHRPCAECRRARYNEFRDAWGHANLPDVGSKVRAPQMDEAMHQERIEGGQKVTWRCLLADLPHGAMFQVGGDSHAVCDGEILKWSFEGYTASERDNRLITVDVLTPRSVVNIFANGFRSEFHPSAIS
ncbi:hypothetical protein MIH18_06145 [Marinobacter sp. M3C]|uniref:hypothetical protein n=1 Tax=Marinobacter sp. M3C TaxID=2917715 RepID=UPI00200C6891|nr:hypothetical protein [Marinobacter sp. M3C]UQG61523.1 hypothetical protein MIH18_06145 [Marinobacter sp. M3C]